MALIDKCISGQSEEFSTEFRMRHKEGRWVDILSRAILIRDDDGTPVRMVGTHVDISQQKHAAQVLINHNQYLEEAVQQRTASLEKHRTALQNNQTALTSLLQSTTLTQSPLPEVLAHITEIFAGHLGVARVSIWQRTLDGNAIACVDLYEAAKGQHCAGMNLHRQDYIAYFDALDRNIVIDAVNAHTHAATAKFSSTYLTPLGISSMLDVPIFAHGRNWGVICCEHVGQIRTWTAEEIAFAIAVVALVALAVETEEHRATMLAFEKAKDAAEAANRAKSAFLANMSHELRTPMHGVMGMIALATRRVVDPKVLEQLHKAKLAAERLGGVLDDILDLSKIEADRLELEERPLQLAETIDQIRATLNNKAEEKGLRLAVDIPSLLANVHLVGDALRLGQILMNLVGNAIKFTDRGEVTVRVHPVGETAEALQVRFEVIDSGIGIDPEVQRRLFQSFEQADNSMTRKYGGTGLGLAICKRLVRMMGGEIGMQSVQGLGSTFWFVVRLKKQEHRTATPARTVANVSAEQCLKSTYAGMRSLLVEDEPINQEVARELLEYVCLEVDLAEDGQQALELAKRRSYAVILMDMQMPVMNGIDATKEIRAHSLNRETPIIAITANASEADRAVCLAAGMNEHIAKPMDPKQLYEILLTLLERHRGLSMKSGHSPDG
jgi:signal transduction histidine kinase/ActR/RegA family two-component response regulator